MKRNWKKYNQSLVRRGEIMLSFDAMEQWSAELKEMNQGKEGHRFVYPETFMEALGYCPKMSNEKPAEMLNLSKNYQKIDCCDQIVFSVSIR